MRKGFHENKIQNIVLSIQLSKYEQLPAYIDSYQQRSWAFLGMLRLASWFSQRAVCYEMKAMETFTGENTTVILYNEGGIKIYLFCFLHRYTHQYAAVK